MKQVNKYTIEDIINILLGKKVHFVSDCEFFPNFDVTGKVISYKLTNTGEILFKTQIEPSKKKIDIGSNMKNLQFELI